MKTSFYLIVSESGRIRTTKTRPDLKWDEVAIYQKVELPDRIFQKPVLNTEINAPESLVEPRVLTPEMTDNIKQAIEEASGLEVKITFPEIEQY